MNAKIYKLFLRNLSSFVYAIMNRLERMTKGVHIKKKLQKIKIEFINEIYRKEYRITRARIKEFHL